MSGTKEKKAGFPMQPLIWLVLYLANLAVVLLFQCTFIHTHSAPLTADSLTNLPYFDGCQILDIFGTQVSEDALRGKADPNWILFQDPDGKILSVRVEWNLYVPRFRIEEDTAVGIPADVEQYSFVERDFFGQNEIVVDGQNTFPQSNSRVFTASNPPFRASMSLRPFFCYCWRASCVMA